MAADEVRFAADLYRGAAAPYDRYRLPYPAAMIADLVRRAGVSGHGRLLDLACGTGQRAFPLRRLFAEVWAVDQEPDMIEVVRAKAAAEQARNLRPVLSAAEALDAPPGYFELAVVGNAFHRLNRDLAARRILGSLQPGGHLALCSSSQPWDGEQRWQRALAAALDRWKAALGAGDRIPAAARGRPRRRPWPGSSGRRPSCRPRYSVTKPPRSTPTSPPASALPARRASSPRPSLSNACWPESLIDDPALDLAGMAS